MVPATTVPAPGRERIVSEPPSAAIRSAMFWSPEPFGVVSASNPTPSSVTVKSTWVAPPSRWIRAFVACAYFRTFWRASRQQK